MCGRFLTIPFIFFYLSTFLVHKLVLDLGITFCQTISWLWIVHEYLHFKILYNTGFWHVKMWNSSFSWMDVTIKWLCDKFLLVETTYFVIWTSFTWSHLNFQKAPPLTSKGWIFLLEWKIGIIQCFRSCNHAANFMRRLASVVCDYSGYGGCFLLHE